MNRTGNRSWISALASLVAGIALATALVAPSAHAAGRPAKDRGVGVLSSDDATTAAPRTNNGKPWRIAYYEGGAHSNYYQYLRAVAGGLLTLGWLQADEIPEMPDGSARSLWQWLTEHSGGKYIDFLSDGFYSAGWDNHTREQLREEIISRLNGAKDVDLIFAMGTWAGKDLATDQHSVPTSTRYPPL